MDHKKRQTVGLYLAAFFLPVIVLSGVYVALGIFPFGEKSLLTVDLNNQYIHMLLYCKEMLQGKASWLYTFATPLGSSMQGISAYYLMSPFNLLLFLFPNSEIASGILLITLLKTGMGSLFFAVMCRIMDRKAHAMGTLLFSCSFALMAYSVVYQQNIMWLDSVMLLPLVAAGIYRIRQNRQPFLYMISLALTLLFNYYIGYMICIFSVLFFAYLFVTGEARVGRQNGMSGVGNAVAAKGVFFREQGGAGEGMMVTLRFAVASLLGGGLAMCLLIPTFRSLAGGKMGFDPEDLIRQLFVPRFHWSDFFVRLLPGSFTAADLVDGLPNVFCGTLALFFAVCFFLNRRFSVREKTAAFLLLLFLYLSGLSNGLYMFWHGFNHTNWFPDRHSFVWSFFLLFVGLQGFKGLFETGTRGGGPHDTAFGDGRLNADGQNDPGLHEAGGKAGRIQVVIAAVLLAGLALWMWSKHFPFMNRYAYLLFFAVLAGGVLTGFFAPGKRMGAAAVILLVLGIVDLSGNAYLTLSRMNYKSYREFSTYYAKTEPAVAYVKDLDPGLYRMEKTFHKKECEPMTFAYRGLSHYSSAAALSTLSFLEHMGFTFANTWAVYNKGSTYAADSLLGVKYILSKDALGEPYRLLDRVNKIGIYENPYALPLGFAVSEQALSFAEDGQDRVRFQNELFKSLSPAVNAEILRPVDADMMLHNLIPSEEEPGIYLRENPEEEARIEFTMTAPSDDPLFAFLYVNEQIPVTLSVNGEDLGAYLNIYDHNVIRLGSYRAGEKVVLRVTLQKDTVNLTDAQFFRQDMQTFAAYYDDLSANAFAGNAGSDDRISGEIETTADKPYILLTLPKEEGWTVYVDGARADIEQAAGILMAVKTEPGRHFVELRFVPPGLILGIVLSVVSLLLTWVWCVVIHGRRK